MNFNAEHFDSAEPDRAYREMMSLFQDLTLRQRIQRTLRGLGQPRNSGDYKFAKLQVQLLSGPFLAILLPVLCVTFLLSLDKKPTEVFLVDPIPVTIDPQPITIDPPPPLPPDPTMVDPTPLPFDGPTVTDPTPLPTPDRTLVKNPVNKPVSTFVKIKSTFYVPGIYPRGPDTIDKAVKDGQGTPEGQKSVMCALRWLKSKQQADGSWPGQPTAMTGLALLTFLAHGETTDSRCVEFGPTVEKGIKYLIENQSENGLFKSADGNNYAHPIATYALCEAYTLTRVPMVKEAAEKALRHVVRGQHPTGGWDYRMKQTERDDTSYMGWCAQAIKAGHMAKNLDVDGLEEAYRNAARGFKKNSNPGGGFGYTDKTPTGLSGVGVLCLQLLGAAKDPEVGKTLSFLDACTYSFQNWQEQPYKGGSPVYYWYYITQAKFHEGGARWDKWSQVFEPELIRRQVVIDGAIADTNGVMKAIGYWDSPSTSEHTAAGGAGGTALRFEKGERIEAPTTDGARVQDTCLSALQLMVYYRYLPTYKTPADDVQIAEAKDDDVQIKITR